MNHNFVLFECLLPCENPLQTEPRINHSYRQSNFVEVPDYRKVDTAC